MLVGRLLLESGASAMQHIKPDLQILVIYGLESRGLRMQSCVQGLAGNKELGVLASMTTLIAEDKRLEMLTPGSYSQTEVCCLTAPVCCVHVRQNSRKYRFAS